MCLRVVVVLSLVSPSARGPVEGFIALGTGFIARKVASFITGSLEPRRLVGLNVTSTIWPGWIARSRPSTVSCTCVRPSRSAGNIALVRDFIYSLWVAR